MNESDLTVINFFCYTNVKNIMHSLFSLASTITGIKTVVEDYAKDDRLYLFAKDHGKKFHDV